VDKGNSNYLVGCSAGVLSMCPQYQVFHSTTEIHLSQGNHSSNQKRLLSVRTSWTLIACLFSASACNYRKANTEHELIGACNNHKVTRVNC